MNGQIQATIGTHSEQPALFTPLSSYAKAVLALVAANVIWGTTFVATKPMLERVPPLTLATARFAVALAVLLPLVWRAGVRPARGRPVALMGLTGVFLLYLCQNVGLQYTAAANGALIHGAIPVLTVVLAAVVLGERLDARRLAGIGLGLGGVVLVVLGSGQARLGLSALGDGLLLASALSIAAYLVLGRLAFATSGSLAVVAGVARYGFFFLLPAAAIELATGGMSRPTGGDVLRLLYLGAGASALAFVLWGYGLRHLEAGRAAAFTTLSPLVGVAAAALVLGEPVTSPQVAGALLVLLAVCLTTRQPGAGDASVRRLRMAIPWRRVAAGGPLLAVRCWRTRDEPMLRTAGARHTDRVVPEIRGVVGLRKEDGIMDWRSQESGRWARCGTRLRAHAVRRAVVVVLTSALLLGTAAPGLAAGSVGSSSAGNDYRQPPPSAGAR